MSPVAPAVYSPRPALIATLAALVLSAACLGMAVYQLATAPAQGLLPMLLPLPILLSMIAVIFFWMPYCEQDNASGKVFGLGVAGLLLSGIMFAKVIGLALPHPALVGAQQNINKLPAIALQASRQVRETPWNLSAPIQTLRPASLATDAPEEFALFKAAANAGLTSPEINWVLANGIVTREAKQALLESLVAAIGSSPNPELAGLLAQIQAPPIR